MIDQQTVEQIVTAGLQDSDCFLVEVRIGAGNVITVEIDNEQGVDIERCEKLHRYIESQLNRDVEDYELEVGSAGLTSPFKVPAQYRKNVGNEVEVLTRDGRKLTGVLASTNDEGFVLAVTKKVKPQGAKRKVEVTEELPLRYDEVKYTKYLIRFK